MTITEFLLARIAEDEALAQEVAADAREDFARNPANYGGQDPSLQTDCWQADGNMGDPVFAMGTARALAECKAKRRIVEECTNEQTPGEQYSEGFTRGLEIALCLMAEPYADHPDFNPAWRDFDTWTT